MTYLLVFSGGLLVGLLGTVSTMFLLVRLLRESQGMMLPPGTIVPWATKEKA